MTSFGKNGIVDLKLDDDQNIDPLNGEIGLHATPIVARDVVIVGAAHKTGANPPSKRNVKEIVISEDVIETLWQRLMRRGEGFHIALVAVDDADIPVGLAHVLFHRSTWSNGWYCYLEDLFVDPARRQAGAGRALIEAVYAEADARQCARVYWMTQETNATARTLYDRVASKSPFVQYRR